MLTPNGTAMSSTQSASVRRSTCENEKDGSCINVLAVSANSILTVRSPKIIRPSTVSYSVSMKRTGADLPGCWPSNGAVAVSNA